RGDVRGAFWTAATVGEGAAERVGERARLGGDDGAVGEAADDLANVAGVDAGDGGGAGEGLAPAGGGAFAIRGDDERVGGGVDERHLGVRDAVDDVERHAGEERDGGARELGAFDGARGRRDEDDALAAERQAATTARLVAIARDEAAYIDAVVDH